MSFNLVIPKAGGIQYELTIELGQIVFVLGANGSGKSSLMQKFYTDHQHEAIRISGHRQNWFPSNGNHLSSQQRQGVGSQISSNDATLQARWRDENSSQRASVAIYDLINAMNIRARSMADAVDAQNYDLATERGTKDAPINIINKLFHRANIPIELFISETDEIFASKSGGARYSIAELSDGERNALLLGASILTARANMLILIDEPERHLHRSIISPLLTRLFSLRPDCAFIVATHDVMLPLDNPDSSSLLVRNCTYSGTTVTAWDADLLSSATQIDDDIKKDILGARRKILFIEGVETSLDKPLYSIIFPNVTIIPKGGCRDVDHAVSGIREADELHWVHAFGIVDSDGRTSEDLDKLKAKGIYALPVYSVESIYYHPKILSWIAERQEAFTGENPTGILDSAIKSGLESIHNEKTRLSLRMAEKRIHEQFYAQVPKKTDIAKCEPICIKIDVKTIVAEESERYQRAFDAGDLAALMARYPLRETKALAAIAQKFGLNAQKYEFAVRKLLRDDECALTFIKSLFGTLAADLNAVEPAEREPRSFQPLL